MSGRGTPAVDAARRAGVAFLVHEYEPRSRGGDASRGGWGMEAADALGVDPARVFKTLVAQLENGRLVVGVVPVDRELDLKALAVAVGGRRARMAQPTEAERATGYVVGGISPLGQRRRLTMVIDASALDVATILVSGGRRGLDLELAGVDLVRLTAAVTARIAREA